MNDTLPPRSPFPSPDLSGRAGSEGSPTREFEEEWTAIGPYRVVRRLGLGGMGAVYQCRDDSLDRFVAVKVIRRKFAGDEQYRHRFQREARSVASVSHTAVAHVYEIGEFSSGGDSLLYLAMEYVDGPSVEKVLEKERKLPLAKAVRLVREVALGLREALAQGIIHRDIKPSNLILTPTGSVKIVDFGLAKDISGCNSVTDEGIVLGTPHYLSPEQGRGHGVDHRADIYSLGATFYHLLTGRPPFEGDSQVSVIVAHVNDPPVPPDRVDPGVPEGASRVILKMLAKEPDWRYRNYDDLVVDLEALAAGEAPPHATASPAPVGDRRRGQMTRSGRMARRAFLAGAGVVGLSLAALAGAWITRVARSDGRPDLEWLGSWYRRLDDGRDLLQADFGDLARDPQHQARVHRLLVYAQQTGARANGAPTTPPRIETSGERDGTVLRWSSFSGPLACTLAFTSMDEVRLEVGPTQGTFDVGLSIVDPTAPQARRLSLRLRPLEVTPAPIAALRHGEPMLLRPVVEEDSGARRGPFEGAWKAELSTQMPVQRLGPGPFEISLNFRLEGDETSLLVRIGRKPDSRPLYHSRVLLPGTDWTAGVLVLETPSPIVPFAVSLERLLVSGRLASTPILESIPWRS